MKVVRIGPATLYRADAKDVLPKIDPVDAVVTSPPYDAIRDYGKNGTGPTECIPLIADRVKAGGVAMWNVADQTVKGSETGTSFRQALAFMDCGLRLHDTMIYCKEGVTFPDANRYHPAFEYMFVFSRGAPLHFNGIKDWKNKTAGRVHDPGNTWYRKPDGSLQRKTYRSVTPEVGLRRNWWIMGNCGAAAEGHPAMMPFSMARDHISTWTAPGETVLDPFMGSGTTGVAALQLGRHFVGIEVDPGYFEIAVKRIRDAYKACQQVETGKAA